MNGEEKKASLRDEELAGVAGGSEELCEEEKFETLLKFAEDLYNRFPASATRLRPLIKDIEDRQKAGDSYENAKMRFLYGILDIPEVRIGIDILTVGPLLP